MSLFLSRPSSRRLLLVALLAAAACSPDGLTGPSGAEAGRALANVVAGWRCDIPSYTPSRTVLGWNLDFEDEFTDSELPNWNLWHGGAWNEEEQLYVPENVTAAAGGETGSGGLTIEVRKPEGGATGPTNPYDATPKQFKYTSGRIESKQLFALSRTKTKMRMLARIKFSDGGGMWPAFWSYGDPWPTKGEIDILEARGLQSEGTSFSNQDQDQYQSAYWYGRRQGVNLVSTSPVTFITGVSLTSCYHVYEVTWEKNQLTFRFDGGAEQVISGGYVPSMFGKQQKLVLNLAVGGVFFGSAYEVEPGSMKVDWVRVYSQR
jgi:beta-glucanase (GH16 family)